MTSRGLVAYSGVDDLSKYKEIAYFNQLIIDFTYCLPLVKPDIQQIIKVSINPIIRTQQLVRTPQGVSLEGKKMTGYKWMVSGDIIYQIQYEACDRMQNMCAAQSVYPFGGGISLPEDFNPNMMVRAMAVVEDICTEKLDDRCTYNNVAMMLLVDLC